MFARPAVFVRPAVLALLASAALCACAISGARAEARFGDSNWVAPASSMDGDSLIAGPRVAMRDHEQGWETALRAPFRVVFFPLRLVGTGVEASAGFLGPRYFEPKPKPPPKSGPVFGPNISIGGLNDIGIGPAVTWAGFPMAGAKFSMAGSWSGIDRRRARLSEVIGDRRPVSFRLRADYDYKPNRRYYGIGNETPASNLSYFLLETSSAEGALMFGASPLRQVRLVAGFSSMSPRRGYQGSPLLEDVFAPASAPFEHRTTQELSYGATADLAALDDARDPSLGVHGRAELRRVAGLRSEDPDYDQWRFEGRAYLPVFAKRRVIALRAVYAGVDPTGGTTALMPYYRLAQSDGTSRFAGYSAERFRDRQLAVGRIEYRWAILYRLSAVALYELGEVAPHAASFRLASAHSSYGGGLRLGLTDEATLRVELANSADGLHATAALGADF